MDTNRPIIDEMWKMTINVMVLIVMVSILLWAIFCRLGAIQHDINRQNNTPPPIVTPTIPAPSVPD